MNILLYCDNEVWVKLHKINQLEQWNSYRTVFLAFHC